MSHSDGSEEKSCRHLYMYNVAPSWSLALIALLLNKDLVEDEAAVRQAQQVYLERLPLPPANDVDNEHSQTTLQKHDGAVVRLTLASAQESRLLSQAYDGMPIPRTHGYHYFSFSTQWPLRMEPQSAQSNGDNFSPQHRRRHSAMSPPLHLRLLALPTPQLQRRWQRYTGTHRTHATLPNPPSPRRNKVDRVWQHAALAQTLARVLPPAVVCTVDGVPLTDDVTQPLLDELRRCTLWPPRAQQRAGIQAGHYLTLRRSQLSTEAHQRLWNLCQVLLMSVLPQTDAHDGYTALAITHNVQGSPHIDAHDTTFQHVVAMGDFVGGHLCVDDGDNDDCLDGTRHAVTRIQVHNKLARLDGRHVHWVDAWEGTERYSVVYYSTSQKHATPPVRQMVHNTWMHDQQPPSSLPHC